MTLVELISVIQSIGALLLVVLILYRYVPAVRVDVFRQRMFALRDELFDFAAAGHDDFNHRAYAMLRQSMNGYIRYAERLTFFHLCLTAGQRRLLGAPDAVWHKQWELELATLPSDELRSALRAFHSRAGSLVAEWIVLGSPVLIAVAVAMAQVLIFHIVLAGTWKRFQHWPQKVRRLSEIAADKTVRTVIEPEVIEDEAVASAAA